MIVNALFLMSWTVPVLYAWSWVVYRMGRRNAADTIASNLHMPRWVMRAVLDGRVVHMHWTEADEKAATELLNGDGK